MWAQGASLQRPLSPAVELPQIIILVLDKGDKVQIDAVVGVWRASVSLCCGGCMCRFQGLRSVEQIRPLDWGERYCLFQQIL